MSEEFVKITRTTYIPTGDMCEACRHQKYDERTSVMICSFFNEPLLFSEPVTHCCGITSTAYRKSISCIIQTKMANISKEGE